VSRCLSHTAGYGAVEPFRSYVRHLAAAFAGSMSSTRCRVFRRSRRRTSQRTESGSQSLVAESQDTRARRSRRTERASLSVAVCSRVGGLAWCLYGGSGVLCVVQSAVRWVVCWWGVLRFVLLLCVVVSVWWCCCTGVGGWGFVRVCVRARDLGVGGAAPGLLRWRLALALVVMVGRGVAVLCGWWWRGLPYRATVHPHAIVAVKYGCLWVAFVAWPGGCVVGCAACRGGVFGDGGVFGVGGLGWVRWSVSGGWGDVEVVCGV